jgi:hypothetical protein
MVTPPAPSALVDDANTNDWRCASAITRYQEGIKRIPAIPLEGFCRLVAISPPIADHDVITS